MIKYIIREIASENIDTHDYFDTDAFNKNSGDYCNTLFILSPNHYSYYGYNIEEFNHLYDKYNSLLQYFDRDETNDFEIYNDLHKDYPEIVTNVTTYISLKGLFLNTDLNAIDAMARFLEIATGKQWETCNVYGYSQGDFCTVLYCQDHYENPRIYGDIWLGCCKEFHVIKLDEYDHEINDYYGYFVADCQTKTDNDYKRIVCDYAGIDKQETVLELIEKEYTITKYEYRRI